MTDQVKQDMSFMFNVPVRGVYLNVFEAKAFKKNGKEVGEAKFGVTLMMEPDHPELKGLKAKMGEAAKAKWPSRPLSELKFPLSSGDKAAEKAKAKGKNRDFMKGLLVLTARSKFPPVLSVLENGKIITLESDMAKAKYKAKFYSGCVVAASVNFVAYDSDDGDDGVTAYIQSLLWVKDGERIGGRDQAEVFKSYQGTTTAEDPLAEDAGVADDEIPY